MADDETIVKLKIDSDVSGAKSAEKALDNVGAAAKRAEDAVKSSAEKSADNVGAAAKRAEDAGKSSAGALSRAYGGFSRAVSAASRAVGTFTKALGLIGLAIQAVQLAIGAFQKLKDWLDRDKKAAEELARAIQDDRNKAAVEASAAAYERLSARIAETLRLERERDGLADRRLGRERALEDARTELAMQRELAGLDRDDPDYKEKAELVRSKYARSRALRAAERAREDNDIAQARRYAQAAEKDKAADEIEKDVYGRSGDAVISLRRQYDAEMDPGRRAELDRQLDALVAEQKKKLAEIKKLRDEADALRREAENEVGAFMAAKISSQAAVVAQDAADADTRRQMDANRAAREKAADEKRLKEEKAAAEKAADEKTVAEGTASMAGLEATAASERTRAQAAADRYSREAADVFAAQGRYDALAANGGSRKERSAALAALQKEQREAEDAKHEMERVAAEVANTLQGINAQIKALSGAVKNAERRLSQNQADAPEG